MMMMIVKVADDDEYDNDCKVAAYDENDYNDDDCEGCR